MEGQVVAERLNSGDGGESAGGQVEPGAHPVAQGFDGDVEEVVEELAAIAEDAAQRPGHGEDELPVRHIEADAVRDPIAHVPDTPLVRAGAEMTGLAGEGQQLLMTAVRALQAGEPGREVTAAIELVDHGHGVATQRAVGRSVILTYSSGRVRWPGIANYPRAGAK